VGGERTEVTYGELARDVDRFALALRARGVEPGDRVLCIADNSPRWIVADLGILRAGAITVHRGADTMPEEIGYLAEHSGAGSVVAGKPPLLARVAEAAGGITTRVLLEGEADGALSFEQAVGTREGGDLPDATDADRLATVVYTSGTTGRPKGVMLTHENILHNVRVLPRVIDLGVGERFLCVLPSWHMFERTMEYTALSRRGLLAYSSLRTLKQDLLTERPTHLAAVPRLWEGVMAAFEARLAKKGPLARALARFLYERALAWSGCRRRSRGTVHDGSVAGTSRRRIAGWIGAALNAPLGLLGRTLVGRPVRRALGGALELGVSGGGNMPLHIDRFLDAVGVTLLVGYGLTETAPVVALRDPGENVLGTIGRALPETDVRVVDEGGREQPAGEVGELWVRGPQVMSGYYRESAATEAVMRPGGWFRTGDLCKLTGKGDLVFKGRLKDTIVLAGGENVEPAPIESRILVCPYVRQAVVVGQDRKTLAALLVPESEPAAREADRRGISVEDLLREEVRRLVTRSAGFKARELVNRIAVLDSEFSEADGTLTATQKLKRNVILERHADLIERLFSGGRPSP
jgi:long-chain acyl-CoA synthetase